MKPLLLMAVFILMVSVGMSLSLRQVWENWRRLTPSLWVRLLAATFIVPPMLAMGLGRMFTLEAGATAGLFLIGVMPGAPLMTFGVAKKGFDLQIAASYQIWGALLIPLMVPLLVAAGGWLYGRNLWVPPLNLLGLIAAQQFVPLLVGMVLKWLAPAFSIWAQRLLYRAGNLLLLVMFAIVLYALGPELAKVSWWSVLSALLLSAGCMVAVQVLIGRRSATVQTLSICNANRHAGLALLLSGAHLHDPRLVPVIVAYALATLLVMGLYAKFVRREAKEFAG